MFYRVDQFLMTLFNVFLQMPLPCNQFYSSGSKRTDLQAVLPSNSAVSDGESSDSEEEILAYDTDSDPELIQKESGNKNLKFMVISDSDSEQPSTSKDAEKPRKKKLKTLMLPCYTWKKEDIPKVTYQKQVFDEEAGVLTPLQYFYMFFTPEMITYVAEQTNIYSVQCNQVSVNTNDIEIRALLSIFLHMGVVSLPSYEDYWANASRVPQVADTMPLKRFKKLRRYIHFNNSEGAEASSDRYYKVRPILNMLREQCLKIIEENQFSCDETMIPYKGTRAGNLRQYLPSKPHKWGASNFLSELAFLDLSMISYHTVDNLLLMRLHIWLLKMNSFV